MSASASPRFKTVVFDLDGTVADTLPLIYHAFDIALTPVLGKRLDDADIRAMFGPPDNAIIRTLVPAAEADPAIARYVDAYRNRHAEMVELHAGMGEVLAAAADAGMRLGLVTGKSRETAIITLESLGVLDRFGAVYAGDDVERQKPDPQAVLLALADLRHRPGEAGAFVGDSAADVHAGRAAGLTTIAVTWGSPDHDELMQSDPDVVCRTAEGLLHALGLATGVAEVDVSRDSMPRT